ncbi:MAG: histidine phosphatase family protein [Saprospiraceae bacterium]
MKHLILVRHAKSSWSDLLLADKDRPLNARGKRNAPFMAQKLKEKVGDINVFYVSPAKRAKRTAKMFFKLYPSAQWVIDKGIYEGSVSELEDVIYSIPDEVDSAVLFGHNPGFTSFTNIYSKVKLDNLATCGIVMINFEGEKWNTFNPINAKVVDIFYPKLYGE